MENYSLEESRTGPSATTTTTPKAKTPRPRADVFNDSKLLLSKKCRTSTPSSRIIPPRPPTKSTQRWYASQARTRIRRLDKCYEQVVKIGSGHFADVYRARSLDDGLYYAIKKTRLPFESRSDRQRRLQEVRNHESIPPHPNCVQYYKYWEEEGLLYIQTELCQTTLNELIESAEDNKLPEQVVWIYIVDLLLAIKHLHDHDLIHLDIKPENIFISFDNIAKLGDFGLMYDLKKHANMTGYYGRASLSDSLSQNTTCDEQACSDESDSIDEGDSKYLACELMQGKFTKAADIFSLGITIFEIASGMDLPKGGEVYHMLRHNKIDDSYFKGLSTDLINIIKLMMEADYQRRPTVNDLLEHKKIKRLVASRMRHIQLRSTVRSLARKMSKFFYYFVLCSLVNVVVSWPFKFLNNCKNFIIGKKTLETPAHNGSTSTLSAATASESSDSSTSYLSGSGHQRRRRHLDSIRDNTCDVFDSSSFGVADDDFDDFDFDNRERENYDEEIIKVRPKNLLNIFNEIDGDSL